MKPGGLATADQEPAPSPGSARLSRAGLVFGVLALLALVFGVLHFGEAKRFAEIARNARPAWLLVAVGLQVLTYATEAGTWQLALRRAGAAQPLRALYALALVGLFTNQLVPTAGLGGTVLVVRALEQRGVPRSAAVSAVLLELVGYYAAFGMAVGFALAVLARHHDLSGAVIGAAMGIAVLGTTIAVGALWAPTAGPRLPAWVRRWSWLRRAIDAVSSADPKIVRRPSLIVRAWILRGGNFVCDALTLWACLRAVGQSTPVTQASAAFVMGTVARVLGLVPGGLGTFEGGTVGGLVLFDVPLEPALAATLLFRGFTFWLPMVPGLWLSRRLTREKGS